MILHLLSAIACAWVVGFSGFGASRSVARPDVDPNYNPYTERYNIVYDYSIDSSLVDSTGENYTFAIYFKYNATTNDFDYPYFYFKSDYNVGVQPSYQSNISNSISFAQHNYNQDLCIYCAITKTTTAYSVFTNFLLSSYWVGYYSANYDCQFYGYDFIDYDSMNYYRDGRTYFTGAYNSSHTYNWSSIYYLNNNISLNVVNNQVVLNWDILFSLDYYKNSNYMVGYNDGYKQGYDDGEFDGTSFGTTEGYDNGYAIGYAKGYNDGANSSPVQASFLGLLGAIADTPVLIIRNLFSFEFFGISALAVFMTLLTASLVIYFVRKIF